MGKNRRNKPHIPPAPAPATPQARRLSVNLLPHHVPVIGFADCCIAVPRANFHEFAFYETRPGKAHVHVARFIIGLDDIENFWDGSREFFSALEAAVDRQTWAEYDFLTDGASGFPPVDAPAPVCSNIAIARVGLGGVLECYYITESSIVNKLKGKAEPRVIPLFGIQMPTGLLWKFISHIKSILPEKSTGSAKRDTNG